MLWIVIGVEGSGHHLLMDLLSGRAAWNRDDDLQLLSGKVPDACRHGNYLLTSSFPYDQPRDELRRPDVALLESLPLDKRFIAILRNPVDCTRSGVRRGFANAAKQNYVIEDQLAYLHYIFCTQKDESSWATFRYEDFQARPMETTAALLKWLAVDKPDAWKSIKQPSSHPLAANEEKILQEFWNSKRRFRLWQNLQQHSPNPNGPR